MSCVYNVCPQCVRELEMFLSGAKSFVSNNGTKNPEKEKNWIQIEIHFFDFSCVEYHVKIQ